MTPRVSETHLEGRRAEILDAARRVFARSGFDAATMQDIAAEADLSPGSLYRYFASKEDLIRAVWEGCHEENLAYMASGLTSTDSPMDALLAAGAAIWEQFSSPNAREEAILNLLVTITAAREPEFGDEFRASVRAIHAQLEQFIRAAQERGEFDPGFDPHGLAVTLALFVVGMQSYTAVFDPPVDADAVFAALTRLIENSRPGTRPAGAQENHDG